MVKSIYIHIPFCDNICSYCDFPKILYQKQFVNKYLKKLENEINNNYKNEVIETLYIGGGTPSSLSYEELNKLLKLLSKIKKSKNIEYTIECNVESIDRQKLLLMKEHGINRLSIGIETFNDDHLKFLNRKYTKTEAIEKVKLAKKLGFNNINIDLIYAISNQTIEQLQNDLEIILTLNVEHISTYSLIIEPNTKLYIENHDYIDSDLDYEMFNLITKTLNKNNYIHYETSNFSKKNYESKHNLNYWNNKNYYGFGLGASGYINNIRYTNTKSITKYLNNKTINEENILTKKEQMQEFMFLGLRKTKGVSLTKFRKIYKMDLTEVFNIEKLLLEKKIIIKNNYIKINSKNIYTSNDILINFVGE